MVGERSCRLAAYPSGGELVDRVDQWLVRPDDVVTGLGLQAALPEFLDVLVEAGEVFLPDDGRLGNKRPSSLEVHEAGRSVEVELQFLSVEKVKKDDLVLAVAQVKDRVEDFRRLVQHVRYDEDHGPHADRLRNLVKCRGEKGVSLGLDRPEYLKELLNLGWVSLGRQDLGLSATEGMKSNGVPLADVEVGEGADETLAELELALRVAEAHGSAAVEGEVASQVGLGLELLEVIAVGAGEHPPVHTLGILARSILTVLGEFHAGTLVRATVMPGYASLHGKGRKQRLPRNAGEGILVGVMKIILSTPGHGLISSPCGRPRSSGPPPRCW